MRKEKRQLVVVKDMIYSVHLSNDIYDNELVPIYTQHKKEYFLSSKSFLFFICRREENVVRTYSRTLK